MFNQNYFVYINTNPAKTTLYIGITNDLPRRLSEHYENRSNKSTFAVQYYCYNLIYFERFTSAHHAIEREKQLKRWSHRKKEFLIQQQNPNLNFLNSLAFE